LFFITFSTSRLFIIIFSSTIFSLLLFSSLLFSVPIGRVHTSAMTVAILPEAEDVDIKIEEKDLIIETYRSSGPGGQSVNTTDSAVRITHKPTGITASNQNERSQGENKKACLKVLQSRIYEAARREIQEEHNALRSSQLGSGDRSQRIRTYNYPQGRVTDHRINSSKFGIDSMMNGELLDDFVEELKTEEKLEALRKLNDSE
jgi:peptide chain release factor 1